MTSPSQIYPRYLSADGTAWRRFERNDRAPGGTGGGGGGGGPWAPGVTQPVLTGQFTSSANCGPRQSRASMTNYAGTVNAINGGVFTGMNFTGPIITPTYSTTKPKFTDCWVAGSMSTTSDGGQVVSRGTNTGAEFYFCQFQPTSQNQYTDNAIGHHLLIQQSVLTLGVDALGSYNTQGSRTDNVIQGCWIGFNSWYYPDHAHSDGSHCDGIQHQGQSGLWILGNTIMGYITDETGNASTNNPSGSNNGPYPYLQTGQIVMVQLNTGSVSDVHINDNWIYGGANGITVRNTSSNGYTMGDVEIKRNKWMDNGQKQDGSHANYIRCNSGQSVNGVTYSTGYHNMPAGVDANVWGFTGTDAFGVSHTIGAPIVNGIRVP